MARQRIRRSNMGIYDPPEPSTGVLSPQARRQWDAAYAQAMDLYGDKSIAETTAWRDVRMSWRPGGSKLWEACSVNGCVPWPRPQQLPRPQADLVALGVLIEYGYIDREHRLHVQSTDAYHPPILYWDDELKSLYAFPGQEYPACLIANPKTSADPKLRKAADVYKTWTKRQAECASTVEVPIVNIQCLGVADSTSYRSDKWKGKQDDPRVQTAQEYIHKHWHEVWLWQDSVQNPRAIMIEGGELDLHAKGIIH